jgi:hypothetical protein
MTLRYTVASPEEKAKAEAEEGGEATTYIQNKKEENPMTYIPNKPMTYIPNKHMASTIASRGCPRWKQEEEVVVVTLEEGAVAEEVGVYVRRDMGIMHVRRMLGCFLVSASSYAQLYCCALSLPAASPGPSTVATTLPTLPPRIYRSPRGRAWCSVHSIWLLLTLQLLAWLRGV